MAEKEPQKRSQKIDVSNYNEGLKPGGKTKHCVKFWKRITRDPFILDCIRGCKINFTDVPSQNFSPPQIKFNDLETQAIRQSVSEMLNEGVISECQKEDGDFINNIFLREKRDSTLDNPKFRVILNMKPLNKQYVELIHHKICTLNTCCDLLEKHWFMASIDLRNAFFSIPMNESFTKFLKFRFEDQMFKFEVLPMGFRDSPRLFCKILKPVLAHLRKKGFISSVYIDDFFLTGPTFEECSLNVKVTLNLLQSLGFNISQKSCLVPTQCLHHLGFMIDSVNMRICLHSDKKSNILNMLINALNTPCISIKMLASIIGTLVATFQGILYGPLYYRNMELLKINSLKVSQNYNRKVVLNQESKDEMKWWVDEGLNSHKPISMGNPVYVIQSDASNKGWGALMLNTDNKTQGFWSVEEQKFHINYLELKAALLGIQSLCENLSNCHVQIQMDNQTAVSYINNMGGTHSVLCNNLAKSLILWCKQKNIWLSSCHIAGCSNLAADELSRVINADIEWMLDTHCFEYICKKFGTPQLDAFASRINKQLPLYFSFYPDSEACGIDAFAHKWDQFIYLFPPFCLIPRVLRKLREDNTKEAIIIVPKWNSAPWFPMLQKMKIQKPINFGNNPKNLILPHSKNMIHPLFPKLKIQAYLLSGLSLKKQA